MKITITSNGIIDYSDATEFEKRVAEGVANYFGAIESYDRQKWINLAERVVVEMRRNTPQLKSSISASCEAYLHKQSLEERLVRVRPQNEQKGYVDGYSDAVDHCSEIFKDRDKILEFTLDRFLPTGNQ